jgi:beta-N-acetylhexosaminidase
MKLGPAMIDVEGLELMKADVERLSHPQVGGVILFARNFDDPHQLVRLTRAIRKVRTPALPICVDHEGGRVQRFRKGFTRIPPMARIGKLWNSDAGLRRGDNGDAIDAARACGYLIGTELQAHGVDFSFAPVLDLDYGESGVIGDRAFSRDAVVVATLADSFQAGLKDAGMASVGKHFPGHGYVRADSHHEVPVDDRSLERIRAEDLVPFAELARNGMAGVMPAHVIYPRVDDVPAGFSRKWLRDILRRELRFDGLVFSDDLSMEGARTAGGVHARATAALDACCAMVLICNDAKSAEAMLDGLERRPIARTLEKRIERMRGRAITDAALEANLAYLAAAATVARLPGA